MSGVPDSGPGRTPIGYGYQTIILGDPQVVHLYLGIGITPGADEELCMPHAHLLGEISWVTIATVPLGCLPHATG